MNQFDLDMDEMKSLGGSNFLVSAVVMLRKQKAELLREVHDLQERVKLLEGQSAQLINISADRLLEKQG
jgi:hypothetical protein